MKRIIVAAVIGVAVSGGVFASATTLGGVNGQSLGANNAAVTACDVNGVTSAYTTSYNATSKKYDAVSVTVADIATGCVGKTMKVALVNTAGTVLFETTKTVAAASEALTIPAGTPAENVENIAVTIHG